jgi:PAS domain S-box-containing protein
LTAINGQELRRIGTLHRILYRSGVWSKITYTVARQDVALEMGVILAPADKSLNLGLRLIALVYLGIGLYILLRRWTAPKSTHFYIFCLVSFVFYSFKYTGKLSAADQSWSDFDQIIYWANIVAGLLQPALFLHFALTFPEDKNFVQRHRWALPAVYAPALGLLGVQIGVMTQLAGNELLRWNLDRLHMLYLVAGFAAAAAVLWHTYREARTPILRQQMKWVTRGAILAITPFSLLYVLPYLGGALPTTLMKVSAFSLVFLPLTFGYAIVRYRLMDVDLIFKRGMAYTLATASIVALFFGGVGLVAELVHTQIPGAGTAGLIAAIVVTALLFDPVRRRIQERLDRVYYKRRYDYRRTLIEFGRELNAETDLGKMLAAVVDRLSHTLLVERVAVFVTGGNHDGFALVKAHGFSPPEALDLSFLSARRPEWQEGHLFFENARQAVRETPAAQDTLAQLDLNYYLPCLVQNRMIAVIGLGKTADGDFLDSEDVELLETLAGYVGIALQNARLYASLQHKAAQYERLKEFNENIVESISVGVVAVDLEDKVESWNSQMEVMFATQRADAIGRPLSQLFPANFVEEFYRGRHNPGIRNLYKFRMQSPTGEIRVTNLAIAPLVTRRFDIIGRILIVDDITERVDLESQLKQSEKMSSIGLLAAGVAHEVNTPLAVISSYAQMLAKQLQNDEKKSALLEKITRQTFRASEIVNNLLNFSRTSGTEFSEVDVNQIIQDTLALLEHQFKAAQLRVNASLTPGLLPILGNAGKLQQVFLNLFLNARDAMPGGGTLTVNSSNGEGVHVVVSDTGKGIAPEHVERIYDPFFTTKGSASEGPRGTGLGLSVTYGIIQEHAGQIRVESRRGLGTTFYLDFPGIRKAVNV